MSYETFYPAEVDNTPTNNKTLRVAYIHDMKVLREENRKAVVEAEAQRIAHEEKHKADLIAKREERRTVAKTTTKTQVVSRSDKRTRNAVVAYEATAYVALCDTGCTGITASGKDVRSTITHEGMRIIAAPKSIPLGTIVRVNTSNSSFNAIVLDRGGDIGPGRIDILVGSIDDAWTFGRQVVSVEIIK